jgi:hypothetical protein
MLFAFFVAPAAMGAIKLITPFINQLADARDIRKGRVGELPELLLMDDEHDEMQRLCMKEFTRATSRASSLKRAGLKPCTCGHQHKEVFTQKELDIISKKAGKLLQIGLWRANQIRADGVPTCSRCGRMKPMRQGEVRV